MITSTKNPKIQWIRELQSRSKSRREESAFVVEGVRLVEEAQASGWPAHLVLYTGDLSPRGMAVVEAYSQAGTPVEEVSQPVMSAASDTQTPQGILAVLNMHSLPLPEMLDFVFIPDGVRDPGNLGTMLRTAAAAGVKAVFLPPGTADAFAPKVLRSSMGAHFHLPLLTLTWDEISAHLKAAHLKLYLAAADAGQTCYDVDLTAPVALVIGSEAEGAGQEARRLAAGLVGIPMPGGMESLNAAVAAGILLFEVVRQRQGSS